MLQQLGLYHLTTHEDRVEIDREIELRTGVSCDEAIEKGLVSRDEFTAIVFDVLRRRKLRRQTEVMAAYT